MCQSHLFGVGGSEEKQSVHLFPSVPLGPHPAASAGPIGTVRRDASPKQRDTVRGIQSFHLFSRSARLTAGGVGCDGHSFLAISFSSAALIFPKINRKKKHIFIHMQHYHHYDISNMDPVEPF